VSCAGTGTKEGMDFMEIPCLCLVLYRGMRLLGKCGFTRIFSLSDSMAS